METRQAFVIPDKDPHAVFAAAHAIALNPPKRFRTTGIYAPSFLILMETTPGVSSWGESITIRVFTEPTGGSVLEILSQPFQRAALYDWGVGQRNVALLHNTITTYLNTLR